MQSSLLTGARRWARVVALALLLYGAVLLLLQTEAILKLLHGLVGNVNFLQGGFSDLPAASSDPAPLDKPLRDLYGALTLHQPLLPWLTWVAGALLLLFLRPRGVAVIPATPDDAPTRVRAAGSLWTLALGLAALAAAIIAGGWLRAAHLLPSNGQWPGSNFDEMVYYTQARLFTQGAWAYRDLFMAHPPGALWAFGPALVLEKAWGGAEAFVAARQWLFVYSLAAVPLAWLCGRKLGGLWSGGVAALALALDGKAAFAPESSRALPNVGVLETLANATALGALALYLYTPEEGRRRSWWLVGAGVVAGASAMCKLPGLALIMALLAYSLATRRVKDALLLAGGSVAGAGVLALPFAIASPGQLLRQVVFFQVLRPQEVRAGIDQATRIALYPEAQVTLLLAGLGLMVISLMVWRGGRGHDLKAERWALPVLWAAPLAAVFLLGRSYHSQYYTQWAPPLALIGSAIAAQQVWRPASHVSAPKLAALALLVVALLPLLISQWRAASPVAYDNSYGPGGEALRRATGQGGRQAMAFDPGYTFAAGLPPARVPGEGSYLVDLAGYTVYTADDMDRRPWGDLVKDALQFNRERNEADLLQGPEAQAAMLSGAIGADAVVLDQKIALPKLTSQSIRLLEGVAAGREEAGFASILRERQPTAHALTGVGLTLAASYIAPLGSEDAPLVGLGSAQATAKDTLQVGLYWRPDKYPARDYHVVVRLVDVGGNTARQIDTEPSEGSDHMRGWRPGFVYPDLRNIPLAGLPAGSYKLSVRVYDPATQITSQDVSLEEGLQVR